MNNNTQHQRSWEIKAATTNYLSICSQNICKYMSFYCLVKLIVVACCNHALVSGENL